LTERRVFTRKPRDVHIDKASILSKKATGEVEIASAGYQSAEELSEASDMLSTFTDSNWNLRLNSNYVNLIHYKERFYTSFEHGEDRNIL
jgi:hypothetical protein